MPEFRHYALWDEVLEMVRDVVETHSLLLIPEESVLSQPQLPKFDRMGPDVTERLAKFHVVQLEGPFTKYPLEFTKRTTGAAAGTYYASDIVGPRLRWFLPAVSKDSGLVTGRLNVAKTYKNPTTGKHEPPSEEVKQAYESIIATMKGHLVKYTPHKGESVWIGKHAKRQLDEGTVRLGA